MLNNHDVDLDIHPHTTVCNKFYIPEVIPSSKEI